MTHQVHKHLSHYADTNGDGTGNENATGDYSGAPTSFKRTAAPGEHLVIARLIISMTAAALNKADVYGNGVAALTNGIDVYITDANGAIVYYLTDEHQPIKNNTDWPQLCFDYQIFTGFASGDDFACMRWSFDQAGVPVVLLPGWSFNILFQDDLSAANLTEHLFLLQGFYEVPHVAEEEGHA